MKPSYEKTVAKSVIFAGLPPERSLELIKSAGLEIKSFDKGSAIYNRNGFSRSLGIILKGSARVEKQSGGKNIIINTLGEGAVFGMAALFYEEEAFPTELTAQTGAVIAFITKVQLTALFEKEPKLCENYIKLLSERIHFLNKKIEALNTAGQFGRLYDYILAEYKKHGENGAVTLPYNMQELARVLGIGRTSLYRELDSLTGHGIVTKKGKTFIIYNTEELL